MLLSEGIGHEAELRGLSNGLCCGGAGDDSEEEDRDRRDDSLDQFRVTRSPHPRPEAIRDTKGASSFARTDALRAVALSRGAARIARGDSRCQRVEGATVGSDRLRAQFRI